MNQQQLAALFSNIDDLRGLVGRQVRYLDQPYEITDILPAEDMLILSSHEHDDVQEDLYGRATRMVPQQQRLRFRDAKGAATAVWDDFIFIDGAL